MSSPAGRIGYRALWRRPGYAGFVATVSLSRLTTTMFVTTGVLLVLARTHSAALAGGTAAASTLAWAISAPLLGAWLDVARRRRVLIVLDQVLSVIALIGFVLLAGHAPAWTLLADAVLLNITRPLSTGSFFSSLAELAGPELLDRASAVEATSLNLSFIVGPAMAALIAGAAGPAVAIEVQAGLTLLSGSLIAANPAFEARAAERPARAREALRHGVRALFADPILTRTGAASCLAIAGWGLMIVGFPLYAERFLHAGAHGGGYLWAGLAFGSIAGTFALAGTVSLRRMGASYAVLGVSSLLWLVAGSLALGVVLVTFTGFLEGPAYSGTITLRQRHTPPAVRAGVMSTLNAFTLVASAAASAAAGLIGRPETLIFIFLMLNFLAAGVAAAPLGRGMNGAADAAG
jgi:MFS family permease